MQLRVSSAEHNALLRNASTWARRFLIVGKANTGAIPALSFASVGILPLRETRLPVGVRRWRSEAGGDRVSESQQSSAVGSSTAEIFSRPVKA